MFCWHKWGKWSGAINCGGYHNHQVRSCEKCGKTVLRRIVSFVRAHVGASQINEALKGK